MAGSSRLVQRVAVLYRIGTFEVPLSGDYIAELDPNPTAICSGVGVGGTTPSTTYGCHRVPTS